MKRVVALLLLASPAFAQRKVVYGVDDRWDYFQAPENLKQMTRNSIVALMSASGVGLPNSDGVYNRPYQASSLADSFDLCEGESFAEQPTAAFCSGTLIAPDQVLTAGHCIRSDGDCCDMRLVFDYYLQDDGEYAPITTESVYSCVDYISVLEDDAAGNTWDYAVVKLDRAVENRTPAPISTDASPVDLEAVFDIIGFPSGLPAKIQSDFPVRDNRAANLDYFEGIPDTFGGNSGSGVFDSEGTTVGILVRGATDYVNAGGCNRVNVCTESSCSGESISYAYKAAQARSACESDSECSGGKTCQNGFCWGNVCIETPTPTPGPHTFDLFNPTTTETTITGLLVVNYNEEWGTVCDDGFSSSAAADVICRDLGYFPPGRESNGDGTGSFTRIWLDNVVCPSSASSFDDCAHNPWGNHDCVHGEDVQLTCSLIEVSYTPEPTNTPEPTFEPTYTPEPTSGPYAFDLFNPIFAETTVSGLLVVNYNEEWGTVCDDGFNAEEAAVLCHELGYSSPSSFTNGDGSSPYPRIWLDDVSCPSSESSFDECSHLPWGSHNCGHVEDVWLTCTRASPEPTPNPESCVDQDAMITCADIADRRSCDRELSNGLYLRDICQASCDCCTIGESCACNNNQMIAAIAANYYVGWVKTCETALKYISCDHPRFRYMLAEACPCDCAPR